MIGDKEEAYHNQSLERALNILNVFEADKTGLTPAQLSGTLNLPRATVLRLCSTLEKYGFLRQDRETKQYSLGIRLFQLGSIVHSFFSLGGIASRHLSELQTRVGTTVLLGVLDNDDLVYIDKRECSRNPVRFTSDIGRRRPPYWGMVGPAIMAYQPDSEIGRLLRKRPFVGTAKKSFTSKKGFVAWLGEIRKQGYAVDRETAIDGVGGVAAPIRNVSGKVIAALGVSFISSSVDGKGVRSLVREATATAHAISGELGYTDNKEF